MLKKQRRTAGEKVREKKDVVLLNRTGARCQWSCRACPPGRCSVGIREHCSFLALRFPPNTHSTSFGARTVRTINEKQLAHPTMHTGFILGFLGITAALPQGGGAPPPANEEFGLTMRVESGTGTSWLSLNAVRNGTDKHLSLIGESYSDFPGTLGAAVYRIYAVSAKAH